MEVQRKKRLLADDLVAEIERIILRGNTAEVVQLRHELVVFEKKKCISFPNRGTASVEVRE